MPVVSVIMPVYNSESYLTDAVESVLNQTFDDFELILVNDASVDKSRKICNDYKIKDKRVKVIHLANNVGISGARNVGLISAVGEYIAFCDDDDMYASNLLEETYYLAKKYNADMVKYGRRLIDIQSNGDIIRTRETKIPNFEVFKEEELKNEFFYIKSLGVLHNVWNGLYRTEMIKKQSIKFDETMRFGSEDAKFTLCCYLNTTTLVVSPTILYTHFRRNNSSTSRKYNINKINSLIKTAEMEQKIWEELDKTVENQALIIRSANSYIINSLLIQLFHKDCNLKKSEKIKLLDSFKEYPQFSYKLNKSVKKKLLKESPKQALFTFLYNNKKYRSLLFMLKCYNVVWGEKW